MSAESLPAYEVPATPLSGCPAPMSPIPRTYQMNGAQDLSAMTLPGHFSARIDNAPPGPNGGISPPQSQYTMAPVEKWHHRGSLHMDNSPAAKSARIESY
eukprot:781307-Karenia_brevis.AAC.1